MSARDTLWQCECGHYFRDSQALHADHPFDQRLRLDFCPGCREVVGGQELREICDEPGCTKTVSCGWPSEIGYRRTCGSHMSTSVNGTCKESQP